MRWFKPNLRSSLHAIFSSSLPEEQATARELADIEDIRDLMLVQLDGSEGPAAQTVTRRIRYAADVQALWFLRGDLMGVLASRHGEAAAREKIDEVSELFEDLLPEGLRSRPSPLSSTPD